MANKPIGFIGLGKLGLPIAEEMAKHHRVIGFDVEPRLSSCVEVVEELSGVCLEARWIFIAVPTSHAKGYDGSLPAASLTPKDFDYSCVTDVLDRIGPYLRDHHRIVLISTVLPGTVRREIAPRLRAGKLLYNPYLIAMGTERADFLDPEMVIVGTEGEPSQEAEELEAFYRPLLKTGYRFVSGTWEEAEAIKIFYNTWISAKLGLANMVLDVAQRIGHSDADVIMNALAGSTKRIVSPQYMKAGLGDGGPCHPRDNIALRLLSEKLGLGYDLFGAIIQSREAQAENLARFLLSQGKKTVFLGKTYKPGVALTDGSYSVLVSHYYEQLGGQALFYDPALNLLELPKKRQEWNYFVSFWQPWVETFEFHTGARVIDPWRRKDFHRNDVQLVAYGYSKRTDDRATRPFQLEQAL